MKIIAKELASYKMTRALQNKVVELRHYIASIEGYTNKGKYNQERCIEALVSIRILSKLGLEEKTTKKIRQRFADILRIVGMLEAEIFCEQKGLNIKEKLKSIGKAIITAMSVF